MMLMIGGRSALAIVAELSFFGLTGGCGVLTMLFAFFSLQEKGRNETRSKKDVMAAIFFMNEAAYRFSEQISDSFKYQADKKMNFSLIGNLK